MDLSKVDLGARVEDAETSDRTVDVEEPLAVEALVRLATLDIKSRNPSRQPSILEQLTEHVDVVPYLVARGPQKPYHETQDTCTLSTLPHFPRFIISWLYPQKSSTLFTVFSFHTPSLHRNGMRGVGYWHFQK